MANNTKKGTNGWEVAGAALGALSSGLQGYTTGTLVNDEQIQSDLVNALLLGFTIGSTNDLMLLFANTLFAKTNWTNNDIYGGVGNSVLNVLGSAVGGLASGAAAGGISAGIGAGIGALGAITGEIVGAIKRNKIIEQANNQAAAANTALMNKFGEAAESTNVLNNFNLKKNIAAEGGPIHKRGTILKVDEEAYDKLIKQGYKVKIID